jgi:sodium transport system permease protein
MKLRDTWTVFKKELRDTLRDRRTLVSMFLVPAVIMPVILFRSAASTTTAARRNGDMARIQLMTMSPVTSTYGPKTR